MMFKLEREIGNAVLSIEVGKIAKQAHGSAVVRYGDTVCLGTVVTAPAREGLGFFPLTVDYREKMSAAGKFPGGFFKREGRPTNKEILTARMIDRPMRPLFPAGFMDEVLIQVMVLSADGQVDPDTIGMVSAAAALSVAPLPFQGPVAAVRVGRVDGHFVINPTREEVAQSDIDLVVAGRRDAVNMIEVGAKEISDEDAFEAIKFGHEYGVVPICEMLEQLREHAGKASTWEAPEAPTALLSALEKKYGKELREAKSIKLKQDRNMAVDEIYKKAIEEHCPPDATDCEYTPAQIKGYVGQLEEKVVRQMILKDKKRADGRKLDEVRPINCETGWLPRTHGSSLFSRGETQAMVTTTLGTRSDVQIVDDLVEEYHKRFMLHYNFPPFSVGEVRRVMGPGRREIGHGDLAERSLLPVIPPNEEFPYTIRLVSDVLESNGSSSMATVCGGSLSLMDAGVPVKGAVAGISIGLVQEGDKYVLLADILGEEDHFGDMDFKIAGTRNGITGIQLDIKSIGLNFEIMKEAIELAHKVRLQILDVMDKAISKARGSISEHAPRLITLKINPEKIGKVIGPGGKQIRAIQTETGAQIDIDDDGTVYIASTNGPAAVRAEEIVRALTEDIEVGKVYDGKVISLKDFGAFVELTEGQDGLCHISELSDSYVKTVSDVVKVGDRIKVKVIAIDDQGRVKLSRKAVLKEEAAAKGE